MQATKDQAGRMRSPAPRRGNPHHAKARNDTETFRNVTTHGQEIEMSTFVTGNEVAAELDEEELARTAPGAAN
jgi:hypothetical protein